MKNLTTLFIAIVAIFAMSACTSYENLVEEAMDLTDEFASKPLDFSNGDYSRALKLYSEICTQLREDADKAAKASDSDDAFAELNASDAVTVVNRLEYIINYGVAHGKYNADQRKTYNVYHKKYFNHYINLRVDEEGERNHRAAVKSNNEFWEWAKKVKAKLAAEKK